MDVQELLAGLGDFDPDAASTQPFWDDEHISRHMLAAHLDESTDAASRRSVHRQATLDWLDREVFGRLAAGPGAGNGGDVAPGKTAGCPRDIIDLGCGPGLYALPLAARGHRVTGLDLSARSLAHARQAAVRQGLDIAWRQGSYLDLADREAFDLALMIYCDLGALTVAGRDRVLERIRQALRPGGLLVFDFFGPELPATQPDRRSWSLHHGGFWAERSHLLLEESRHFPDRQVCARRMAAIDQASLEVKLWHLRDYYFTPAAITGLLGRHGFREVTIHDAVMGPTDFQTARVRFVIARG